jgi:hypothetical protein
VRAAEAKLLVAALTAAFPHPRVPQATVELYREQLARLPDVDAARSALEVLIANEERLPPIALVLREYRPAARRNAERRARGRELPEPPPDPESARKARELLDRLERSIAGRAEAGLGESSVRRPRGRALERIAEAARDDRREREARETCRLCEKKLEARERSEGICDRCLHAHAGGPTFPDDDAGEAGREEEA